MNANSSISTLKAQPGIIPATSASIQLSPPHDSPTTATTTLASLPTELLLRIFTLSANPSLALLSRDFYTRIGDASRTSVATCVAFLMTRYRARWDRMVIKGLRWKFFNLDVLHALDRLYARRVQRKLERRAARLERDERQRQIEAQLDPQWSLGGGSGAEKNLKRKALSSASLLTTTTSSSTASSLSWTDVPGAGVPGPQDVSLGSKKDDGGDGKDDIIDDEESGRKKRLRTVGTETYWRSTTTGTSSSSSSEASSPYNFFSSSGGSSRTSLGMDLPSSPFQPLVPSPLRSIYSYPALAPKPPSGTDSGTSRGGVPRDEGGGDHHQKDKAEDEVEDEDKEAEQIRIPLAPGFPIPRRLFRGGPSSLSSTPSSSPLPSATVENNKGANNNNNNNDDDNTTITTTTPESDHIALVRELLLRGASATAPSNYPMIRCAQRGNLAMIRTLIRYGGAVPDQVVLRWAIVDNHVAVVDYLLVGGGYETEEIQVAEMVKERRELGTNSPFDAFPEQVAASGMGQEIEERPRRTTTTTAAAVATTKENPSNGIKTRRRLRDGLVPNSECLQACLERGDTQMVDRLLRSGAVPNMKTLMML
ncbi:hypothetical protein DFQ27_006090 [Actinomortierella ambigua]|uniref:F-box domain-containing protein n=1 Tax=Actinomortierella ambigua TaxID=1343610 RepID=A0A9P6PXA5_9FUNG|nr:hypothetical protein DFQ27_006090 [Actinomortierella ambigua]